MIKRLTFSRKILLMPVLAGIAFFLIMLSTWVFSRMNGQILRTLEKTEYPLLELSRDLEVTLAVIQRSFQDAVSSNDQEILNENDNHRDNFLLRIQNAKNMETIDSPYIQNIELKFVEYYTITRDTSHRMISADSGETLQLALQSMSNKYNELKVMLETFTLTSRTNMTSAFTRALRNQQLSLIFMFSIILCCILMMSIFAFLTIRTLTKPLNQAVP